MLFRSAACSPKDSVEISHLSVEYRINPLGVDTPEPRFSWKIRASERGVYQIAYQIIVGEAPGEVKKESGKLWDTGKVQSDQTVNLGYAGEALRSNTKYFWRVRVWLDDENTVWSEPAFFHTGILESSELKAQWITTQEEITDASPLLRKEFQVEKKVELAIAYVTACGFYEFFLKIGRAHV